MPLSVPVHTSLYPYHRDLLFSETHCTRFQTKRSNKNKLGAGSEIIDLTNMSEGYGKAFIDDFVITISRRSVEKASGFGRLYVAKNRAGRDGIIFPVKIDTARSKFEIIGEKTTPMSPADATVQNEQDLKKAIKDKLQHFNSRIELNEVS
jgi:hypothetical protein